MHKKSKFRSGPTSLGYAVFFFTFYISSFIRKKLVFTIKRSKFIIFCRISQKKYELIVNIEKDTEFFLQSIRMSVCLFDFLFVPLPYTPTKQLNLFSSNFPLGFKQWFLCSTFASFFNTLHTITRLFSFYFSLWETEKDQKRRCQKPRG